MSSSALSNQPTLQPVEDVDDYSSSDEANETSVEEDVSAVELPHWETMSLTEICFLLNPTKTKDQQHLYKYKRSLSKVLEKPVSAHAKSLFKAMYKAKLLNTKYSACAAKKLDRSNQLREFTAEDPNCPDKKVTFVRKYLSEHMVLLVNASKEVMTKDQYTANLFARIACMWNDPETASRIQEYFSL